MDRYKDVGIHVEKVSDRKAERTLVDWRELADSGDHKDCMSESIESKKAERVKVHSQEPNPGDLKDPAIEWIRSKKAERVKVDSQELIPGDLKDPAVERIRSKKAERDAHMVNRRFRLGDMVWGKVKSHPWWPGRIFDPAFASSVARKARRKGHVLVAFFGDSTFGWFLESELLSFEHNFSDKAKQTSASNFITAVEEALEEVSRRVRLGLTCHCHGNDMKRRKENKQVAEARRSFQPPNFLSFVKRLAVAPLSLSRDLLRTTKAAAQVLALRTASFPPCKSNHEKVFRGYNKSIGNREGSLCVESLKLRDFREQPSSLERPVIGEASDVAQLSLDSEGCGCKVQAIRKKGKSYLAQNDNVHLRDSSNTVESHLKVKTTNQRLPAAGARHFLKDDKVIQQKKLEHGLKKEMLVNGVPKEIGATKDRTLQDISTGKMNKYKNLSFKRISEGPLKEVLIDGKLMKDTRKEELRIPLSNLKEEPAFSDVKGSLKKGKLRISDPGTLGGGSFEGFQDKTRKQSPGEADLRSKDAILVETYERVKKGISKNAGNGKQEPELERDSVHSLELSAKKKKLTVDGDTNKINMSFLKEVPSVNVVQGNKGENGEYANEDFSTEVSHEVYSANLTKYSEENFGNKTIIRDNGTEIAEESSGSKFNLQDNGFETAEGNVRSFAKENEMLNFEAGTIKSDVYCEASLGNKPVLQNGGIGIAEGDVHSWAKEIDKLNIEFKSYLSCQETCIASSSPQIVESELPHLCAVVKKSKGFKRLVKSLKFHGLDLKSIARFPEAVGNNVCQNIVFDSQEELSNGGTNLLTECLKGTSGNYKNLECPYDKQGVGVGVGVVPPINETMGVRNKTLQQGGGIDTVVEKAGFVNEMISKCVGNSDAVHEATALEIQVCKDETSSLVVEASDFPSKRVSISAESDTQQVGLHEVGSVAAISERLTPFLVDVGAVPCSNRLSLKKSSKFRRLVKGPRFSKLYSDSDDGHISKRVRFEKDGDSPHIELGLGRKKVKASGECRYGSTRLASLKSPKQMRNMSHMNVNIIEGETLQPYNITSKVDCLHQFLQEVLDLAVEPLSGAKVDTSLKALKYREAVYQKGVDCSYKPPLLAVDATTDRSSNLKQNVEQKSPKLVKYSSHFDNVKVTVSNIRQDKKKHVQEDTLDRAVKKLKMSSFSSPNRVSASSISLMPTLDRKVPLFLQSKENHKQMKPIKLSSNTLNNKDGAASSPSLCRTTNASSLCKITKSLDDLTAVCMKFPQGFALPSEAQLRAIFVRFGSFNSSRTRIYSNTGCAQVVFQQAHDAEAALRYAEKNSVFGQVPVSYRLKQVHPTKEITHGHLTSDPSNGKICKRDNQSLSSPTSATSDKPSPLVASQPGHGHLSHNRTQVGPTVEQSKTRDDDPTSNATRNVLHVTSHLNLQVEYEHPLPSEGHMHCLSNNNQLALKTCNVNSTPSSQASLRVPTSFRSPVPSSDIGGKMMTLLQQVNALVGSSGFCSIIK